MSNTQQNIQPNIRTYFGAHTVDIGEKMYLNERSADVHFSFVTTNGAIRRVPAHKGTLAAASDVFDAMFYGELKERGDVKIEDETDAAFIEFLQFFYLVQVKLSMENIAGVMHLADKYNMPKCLSVCAQFLEDNLTIDGIFFGLNTAILYDQQKLKKFYANVITVNTAEVFKTTGFLECDQQALAHILKIDVFSCSEVEVFEACMAWIRAKSNKMVITEAMVKKHMGDAYYNIRFKSMTMLELCSLHGQYEPVLRKDFATITNMLLRPEFRAENFCNEPRQAKWDADDIIECISFKNNKKGAYQRGGLAYNLSKEYVTTFSSSEPLLLGSFVCGAICGSFVCGEKIHVNVEIFEVCNSNGTNAKKLLSMEEKLFPMNPNCIQLPHPVLIKPNVMYKICIGPFPDECVYFSKKLKTVVELPYKAAKIEFHNCHKDENDGKAIGLIPCLDFNRL